jgi:hypothetical protein
MKCNPKLKKLRGLTMLVYLGLAEKAIFKCSNTASIPQKHPPAKTAVIVALPLKSTIFAVDVWLILGSEPTAFLSFHIPIYLR